MGRPISVAEAARRLGISTRMGWQLMRDGSFATGHERGRGRRTLVDEAKVREYADALEAATLMTNPKMRVYTDAKPSQEPDGRYFIRAVEAAELLGLSRQRLEQIISENELAAFRIGRCVLLRPTDVRGYKAWRGRMQPPKTVGSLINFETLKGTN